MTRIERRRDEHEIRALPAPPPPRDFVARIEEVEDRARDLGIERFFAPAHVAVPLPVAPVEVREIDRLRAVEVERGRRLGTLDDYLGAVEGRTDVPAYVLNPARALAREDLGIEDVESFALTGTLADRARPDGTIDTGEARLARLVSRAREDGSWTAVNALTFLVGAERAAFAARGSAVDADRDLGRWIFGVYADATAARGDRAAGAITRATEIEARSARARASGDVALAGALAAEADALYARAARSATSEAEYRERSGRADFDGAGAYAIAAEATITGGRAVIARAHSGVDLPREMPLGLTDTCLLELARLTDTRGLHTDAILALDGARVDGRAEYHALALERTGDVAHRTAYFGERTAEASILDARIALDVPRSPAALASLEISSADIRADLSEVYAIALAADRVATETGARVDALQDDLGAAESALADATARAESSRDALAAAGDAPWIDMRTAAQADRDGMAAIDAATLAAADEVSLARAVAHRDRIATEISGARSRAAEAASSAASALADADRLAGVSGASGTIAERFTGMRLAADGLLARAEEHADAAAPIERASIDLELARRHVRAAEVTTLAIDPGHVSELAGLSRADALVSEAAVIRASIPEGAARVELSSAETSARVELAEAASDVDPGLARDHLTTAEALTTSELPLGSGRDAARARIGEAAVTCLVRFDARFDAIVASGHHTADAADDLYRMAHALVPESDELRAIDAALLAVPDAIARARDQLEAGRSRADALGRTLAREEGTASGLQMSGFITGPAWLATWGLAAVGLLDESFDAVEIEARIAESRVRSEIGLAHRLGDDLVDGASGLGDAWELAVSEGRSFEMLGSMRILARGERGADYDAAGAFVVEHTRSETWPSFVRAAMRDREVPVASAIGGPLLALPGAVEALGDRGLGVITRRVDRALVEPERDSLARTTEHMEAVMAFNLAFETLVGIAATGGLGAFAAARRVESAVEATTMIARMARVAEAMRVAHPIIYGAGVAGALALGSAATSRLAREVFGESSSMCRLVDGLFQLIPPTHAVRPSGAGALGGAIFAGSLAAATSLATPVIADAIGARSETETALVAVALAALMAGGFAAWSGRSVTARAERATRLLAEAPTPEARRAVEVFIRRTEGRVPTEGEVAALRTRLHETLDASTPRARIDLVVDALRVAPRATPAMTAAMSALDDEAIMGEYHRARFLSSITDPAERASVAALTADELGAVCGTGPVPATLRAFASIPGFIDFARSHPAEARALVTAYPVLPGLPSALASATDEISFAVMFSQIRDMLPVVQPHPTAAGLVVITRGPGSPPHVPEVLIRPAIEHDHNGAFHVRAAAGGASALPDPRVISPTQLVVDGAPLASLDGVMVFSGHGSPHTISGVDARGVAQLIAAEILARPPGDLRFVVLEACHQRDRRSLLGGGSNAQAIQGALDAILAAEGRPEAVRILAAARGGPTYAPSEGVHRGGRTTDSARVAQRGMAEVHEMQPTPWTEASRGPSIDPVTRERYAQGAAIIGAGVGVGIVSGYVVYEALSED